MRGLLVLTSMIVAVPLAHAESVPADAIQGKAAATQSAQAQSVGAVAASTPVAAPASAPAPAPAPATVPASVDVISKFVDSNFAQYDVDGDGSLRLGEFTRWMVALRKPTSPNFTGESADEKDWLRRALAVADSDKSGGLSPAEFKRFLSPRSPS